MNFYSIWYEISCVYSISPSLWLWVIITDVCEMGVCNWIEGDSSDKIWLYNSLFWSHVCHMINIPYLARQSWPDLECVVIRPTELQTHDHMIVTWSISLTLPVRADQTLSVLSSDPLTTRDPQNSRHMITWSISLTLPVRADQTLSVLSSDPLTTRDPQNSRHVITWSSWPFSSCWQREM